MASNALEIYSLLGQMYLDNVHCTHRYMSLRKFLLVSKRIHPLYQFSRYLCYILDIIYYVLLDYDWSFLAWWSYLDIHLTVKFAICKSHLVSMKVDMLFLQASAISCCILNRSNFIIAAFYQLRELFTFSLKNNKRIAIALGLFGLWQTSFSFHGFTYATIYHRRSYSNDMLWKISSR